MKTRATQVAAAVGLALAAGAVGAQSAADAPAEETVGLEEIVVTAQKREQNLQDVPVAVTALTAEAIANQRIVDFSDLTRAASSLTITQNSAAPNNSIALRGIGTYAFSIGVEPSVAVIVDDVPVVQQAQAFDNLGDVERIEVLKGPQGTLFGKNASAGVVNIVTKDPAEFLSGRAQATFASDGDYRADLSVSSPLGERAGVRLGAYYRTYDGNVRNLTTGRDLNDAEGYGVRAKFKVQLTDALEYTFTGNYSKTTQDGAANTYFYIDPAGNPRVLGNPSLALRPSITDIAVGKGNYKARLDEESPTSNQQATLAARGVLDLGAVELVAVTSWQSWKYDFRQDFEGTDLPVIRVLTGSGTGGIVQRGPYDSTSFTQELRLVSTGGGPLKYVVGAYFADAETTRSFTRGPVVALADWYGETTSKSYAGFAQLDYAFDTGTTFSGGLRYNREQIGVLFDNLLPTATAATCATGNPACRGENSDSVVTWKGALSQELAPDVMAYASVARGYKGFAYDVSSGFTPARVNGTVGPVKAENSTAYELGLKSRFLDDRVQLNVTAFLTDYDNFQAQSSVNVNGALQLQLNNVGKLQTKGVEVEFSAKPMDWLRLDASVAYTDAKIDSFPNAQAFPDQTGAVFANGASSLVGPCTTAPAATAAAPRTLCQFQDRSGSVLPNSPKFKANLGATGEFDLGAGGTTGIVVVNYQYQDKVLFDLLGNPLSEQAAYGILNASFGITRGKFSATAFVNNLLDENYAATLSDAFGTFGGSATNPAHVVTAFHPRDSERYFGVRLAIDF